MRMMAAAVEPASGRAGMIGDVAAVVAEALGVLRDFDDRVRRQELVRLFGLIERQRDVDFHAGLGSVECGALTTECHRSASICRRCRSEEHTSELQSLMRISYAVF